MEVVENGTNAYKISIHPRDCAHNLDELEVASVSPPSYTLTREQAAGIPPKGNFSIDFEGETIGENKPYYEKRYMVK